MIQQKDPHGSEGWYRARLGVPTASRFHEIITPARWAYSKQARRYAFQLAAEILLREPQTGGNLDGLEHIERGREMEPKAIEMYEFAENVQTLPCGFLTTDDGTIGCTPDRLIPSQSAALEVKCPSSWVHLSYLVDGFGADYLPQVMGQMLVGEFDYVDRYSYQVLMPPRLVRTYRDEERLEGLRLALQQFLEERDKIIEVARAEGLFEPARRLATPIDQAYGEFSRMVPEDDVDE